MTDSTNDIALPLSLKEQALRALLPAFPGPGFTDSGARVLTSAEQNTILRALESIPIWYDCECRKPEPMTEVLVLVDGHRSPIWKNSYPLVAYINYAGEWREERHPTSKPLVGVIKWMSIPDHESLERDSRPTQLVTNDVLP